MTVLVSVAGMPWLEVFLGFLCSVTLLHGYLDVRQLRVLERRKPPPALAAHFSQELYDKTRSYSLDKWRFSFYLRLYTFFETLLILLFGVLPGLWVACGQAVHALPHAAARNWVEQTPERLEIVQTVAFVMVLTGASTIMEVPWSLYRTFVIEHRHGFNKQTLSLFFADVAKGIALGAVLMPPVIVAVTRILQVGGPFLALYLWAFILALSLFLMTIYPTCIAPLFNKFEPLPEGSLRTAIEELAGRLHFPLRKLFKVDGSRRSAHSNAYMYGFWRNKRIVLYDTLLAHCSEQQVVAVLAHELGHWKLRHTPVLFAVSQAVILSNFLLFTLIRASPGLFESFGFGGLGQPVFVSLVVFQFISAPFDEVVHCCQNLIVRKFEFQADGFAVSQGHGSELRAALLKLEEENKSAMHVDALYSAYHYSHPPLVERLSAIDAGVAARRGTKAGKAE
mmetsp:Transcript_22614/g.67349  ORF Transcript_22614/g.67349 Transcript_22614/m.67349 type:complete len:451 (-) Transcript_22614:668-2020(-)